jgi:N-alpha-acetyltransferase 10/11
VNSLVTLISTRPTPVAVPDLPRGYSMRLLESSDVAEMGRLYFESYPPTMARDSLAAATADIVASFQGDYGELWLEASPIVTHGPGLVAAVMTVRRGPWEDTPGCPFVIEVFTDLAHRRRGLARHLLTVCLRTALAADEPSIALRVDPANTPALGLYESLGFVTWP